jgi:hypothetical protein
MIKFMVLRRPGHPTTRSQCGLVSAIECLDRNLNVHFEVRRSLQYIFFKEYILIK